MSDERDGAVERQKVTPEMQRAWAAFDPVIPNMQPSLSRDAVMMRQAFYAGYLASLATAQDGDKALMPKLPIGITLTEAIAFMDLCEQQNTTKARELMQMVIDRRKAGVLNELNAPSEHPLFAADKALMREAAVGEENDWLLRQLARWPVRVDPDKTTNIEFLMKSAAARIEILTAARTTTPTPVEERANAATNEQVEAAITAWEWLAEHSNYELAYEGWEEDEWQVHRVNGGRSDREWTLVATGATPLEAVLAARAALREAKP